MSTLGLKPKTPWLKAKRSIIELCARFLYEWCFVHFPFNKYGKVASIIKST